MKMLTITHGPDDGSAPTPIENLELTDDREQGLEAEDASDEGPCVHITTRYGEGFNQHDASAWLAVDDVRKLHDWLGRWLAVKGADHG